MTRGATQLGEQKPTAEFRINLLMAREPLETSNEGDRSRLSDRRIAEAEGNDHDHDVNNLPNDVRWTYMSFRDSTRASTLPPEITHAHTPDTVQHRVMLLYAEVVISRNQDQRQRHANSCYRYSFQAEVPV
jgi:hypothetical protein